LAGGFLSYAKRFSSLKINDLAADVSGVVSAFVSAFVDACDLCFVVGDRSYPQEKRLIAVRVADFAIDLM